MTSAQTQPEHEMQGWVVPWSDHPSPHVDHAKGRVVGALQDGTQILEFDDRTLVHLQIVISTKPHRCEGFLVSWFAHVNGSDARRSIWLSQAIPVAFAFGTSRVGAINRVWLHELEVHANSGSGLTVTTEPPHEGTPVLKRDGVSAR